MVFLFLLSLYNLGHMKNFMKIIAKMPFTRSSVLKETMKLEYSGLVTQTMNTFLAQYGMTFSLAMQVDHTAMKSMTPFMVSKVMM